MKCVKCGSSDVHVVENSLVGNNHESESFIGSMVFSVLSSMVSGNTNYQCGCCGYTYSDNHYRHERRAAEERFLKPSASYTSNKCKIIPSYVTSCYVGKSPNFPDTESDSTSPVTEPKGISDSVIEMVAECMKKVNGAQSEEHQLLELSLLLEYKYKTMLYKL